MVAEPANDGPSALEAELLDLSSSVERLQETAARSALVPALLRAQILVAAAQAAAKLDKLNTKLRAAVAEAEGDSRPRKKG